MKFTIRGFIVIIIAIIAVAVNAQSRKSVAVLNFSNFGGKGMNYLTKALPESISASLSEIDDLRVVERRNLGRIVDEIALEQSGLVDSGKVQRAGRLSKADVLMLGSITGNPSQIVLTIKAIEVRSGKVLDGRVVKAPLSDIFDSANQAARSMAAIISGKGIGRLSVSTTPQGAKVFIDGLYVGVTPLVEQKVTVGEHRIKATKEGYLEFDESVTIRASARERISTRLAKESITDRYFFSGFFNYIVPMNEDVNNGFSGGLQLGHTFDRFMLAGEFAYSHVDNSEKVDFHGDINKWYEVWSFTAHMNYIFYRSRTIAPYVGVYIGYSRIYDYHENLAIDDKKEEIRNQSSFITGATLGINFIPYARVSPFIECRFFYHAAAFERESYTTESYFVVVDETEKINYMGASIGGGVRIYF